MDEPRLLPLNEVLRRVPICKTTLYAMLDKGVFPKPVKVGQRTFWSSTQITKWIDDKVAANER